MARMFDADLQCRKVKAFIATARYKGVDDVPTGYDSSNPTEYLKGYERGAIDAATCMLGLPTVDAVPVVRCKDCKWFRSGVNMFGSRITNCDLLCIMNDCAENSYCCWGERKDHD